ncbi:MULTISPECIES: hypothetical protein [Bradyrhizobium]|jgi:hypothetical protein|uniref:hypothetical protein n=1 Tax=Bradyrhizobium TaxID=374 RepID=UPI0004BABF5C|nr:MULTISPECIES: hypothetical protein [Bradyrhizobium]MCS3446263.1 hypothetical protein [Bradyrhizobium elkanii]MCS3562604.1 hypothetical protein [Bradyrhizobium elkanii]MCW2147559.1 hypothetical protein [Bradyrhizobium elkanii]MCW2353357.1 hypothetical protein [Bradyrhizobium elkanii]MCW2371286.1 hypothetical protein [Bradyrhizobium elkanii]
MTFTLRFGWARLPVLAAGFGLAMALSAAAQIPPWQIAPAAPDTAADNAEAAADEEPPAANANDADILKDIDESKLDWSQLDTDSTSLPTLAPKRAARPASVAGNDPSWSTNNNANGSSAVSVKQSISPFLDTRIGADMTVARQGTMTTSEQLSERLANGGSLPQSGGSAWAAISTGGVASIWDKTSVEARVDPSADQSKVGTSLSKSVPLSEQYSLTLQNGYNLIQQGVVPVPGIISHPSRSYDTDQSASLSVSDTGTSITAGQTLSTSDDRWLRRIGAEQKLFDGVTVSGSVGETSQGATNKSISAGYKRSW